MLMSMTTPHQVRLRTSAASSTGKSSKRAPGLRVCDPAHRSPVSRVSLASKSNLFVPRALNRSSAPEPTVQDVPDNTDVPAAEGSNVPFTEGMISVTSRSQLPFVDVPDCVIDVYYAEEYLAGARGAIAAGFAELLDLYHSSITLRVRDNTTDPGIPKEMTFEYNYAGNDFPKGVILPTPNEEGELVWTNRCMVNFTPSITPSKWTGGEKLVGTISGQVFNDYCDWAASYLERSPDYQLFDVWDRPTLTMETKRFSYSSTCDSFTEASLAAMYAAGQDDGTDFSPDVGFSRNYLPLISLEEPQIVDMTNAHEADLVRDFYAGLDEAMQGQQSLADFMYMLGGSLKTFYLYDCSQKTYLRVKMVPPYLNLRALYQPQTTPWRDPQRDTPLPTMGEEPPQVNLTPGDFFQAVKAFVTDGVVPLAAEKLGPELTRAALILGVAILSGILLLSHWDFGSFVGGVITGAALIVSSRRFFKK